MYVWYFDINDVLLSPTFAEGQGYLVVGDTQSDSIQYLNFAKKWSIQYSIQYCCTKDSIQNIIQFFKKICWFNSKDD